MDDMRRIKQALRKELMAERRALGDAEREARSAVIVDKILADPAWHAAKTVFSFMPMEEELNVEPLLVAAEREGKRIGFPVCFPKGRMEVYARGDHDWEIDNYGIRVPVTDENNYIPADEIDLVIAPLLGFDREKYRIGYGAGFYDRFIERLRPDCPVIGVAFSVQERDRIPREPTDKRLTKIYTEKETIA